MIFYKDKNSFKARKILRDNGFLDVLERVCCVMESITKNGITGYSNMQALKTYFWGIDVLSKKYEQIKKTTPTKLHTELYLEYRNYVEIFDIVEARVVDEIEKETNKQENSTTNKIVFAIDVDNVLRDNLGEMVKLYNEHFNESKNIEEITNYKTEVMFPRIEQETGLTSSQWFFQDHSDELFVKAKPFDNVSDDIKKLREYGDIVIVTYQKTILNKVQTLEWLDNNRIEYDSIVFTKDKSIVDCDYFIDDNDWNFQNCKAEYGALINAPYNKEVNLDELSKTTKSKCTIERFNSFHDFVKNFIENKTK